MLSRVVVENPHNPFPIYQTEIIKNTLNPAWKPVTLDLGKVKGTTENPTLRLSCFDWDSDGSHDLIADVALSDLLSGAKRELALINPNKVTKSGYKNSGTIFFSRVESKKVARYLSRVCVARPYAS